MAMILLSIAMMLVVTSSTGALPAPHRDSYEQVSNITENDIPGTVIAAFQAYDKRPADLELITFRIDPATDPKRQFSIDDQGILRIAKNLDREDIPRYRLKIEAEDTAWNIDYTFLQIYLKDVNDNAPSLRPDRVPVVYGEEPFPQLVAKVFARDPDTPENGPPFKMRVPPDSKYHQYFDFIFDQNADGGRGVMTISAKVGFRGDLGKEFQIPIHVRDSGHPVQVAVRYLRVIFFVF